MAVSSISGLTSARSGRLPVEGRVVFIPDRGAIDAPEAAVERPERRQQQGEGDAAVGARPEDGPERLDRELAWRPVAGELRAVGADAHGRAARRHAHAVVPREDGKG